VAHSGSDRNWKGMFIATLVILVHKQDQPISLECSNKKIKFVIHCKMISILCSVILVHKQD